MAFLKFNSIRWRFGLALVTLLLLELLMLGVTWHTASGVGDEWRHYQDAVVRRQALLMEIRAGFGYGGMIHGFKNYVLRHDAAYAERAAGGLATIARAIADYRGLIGLNAAEVAALDGIEKVAGRYASNLELARRMVAAGASAAQTDALVRVDDEPAYAAFAVIGREFASHTRAAEDRLGDIATRMGRVLGSSFLALVLTNLFAVLLIRRVLRSLDRAVEATTRIAGGDLCQPVAGDSLEETGHMLDSMRLMQASLLRRDQEDRQQAARLRMLAQAIEQSPESIVLTDPEARIEYVNQAFVANSGYAREDVIGQNPRILHSGNTAREVYQGLWTTLGQGRIWEGVFRNRRKDGQEYVEAATISPVRDDEGRITHYLAVKQNITEKLRAEAEMFRLAYFDGLTGLPNRSLLTDRLGQLLETGRRSGHYGVLMLLDLDAFKTINDGRGMETGDILLRALGERLGDHLRAGDTLARLAADEFAILLSSLNDSHDVAMRHALSVAEKMRAALALPFLVGGDEITMHASLGVAVFPHGERDAAPAILQRAGTALHRAKGAGGNQTAFFDSAMGDAMRRRYRVERDLRKAIAAGELRLYLQPQVMITGQWVGAEALLRWQHPLLGLLAPAEFVPLAEESDLIVELERWVLTQVGILARRLGAGGRPLRLSVNISPRHFRKAGFVPWLKDFLQASGADPNFLTLEVTEGLMIDDVHDTVAKMEELSALGIHFSMDDFGTGYSSLAYLKQLPIQELKIDQSFIQDAPFDARGAVLLKTILAVAEHMNLRVVAEGVEEAAHALLLEPYAHVIHQGFLHGRPEPSDVGLARWLAALPERR